MSSFIPFDRSQPYLLPPDLKSWLPSDDVAHFIVAAVERVPLRAFSVPVRTGGKAQYHPRLMLALLIYAYANGVFSSRRIERATYRDIGMRFVAANLHPDHDTIAAFRRSDAHEYRQAYNAQAVVCAEGSQLILENGVVATTADAPSFAATILGMEERIGLPRTVLADTGFASGKAIQTLQASGVDPLVAIGRPVNRRPYDFRPEPPPREPRRITEPWRLEMKARLQQNPAKALYALRKQTVEPVFGIIKSAMGFTRFHLRGLSNVATEWTLVALAYNCRRITRLTAA
ncbi:transposase [Komagataeibacter rhaeticus]|nr:transposase [Komagataeibacter rhaeticus]